MIFGFSASVISSLRPRQHIEERLTLIVEFLFYSGFFSSEAFGKPDNRVSTDVADKHARYISEITASQRSREVTNELGDNGAHRCVDYCFVNAPPLYLPRRYAIANARITLRPDALFLCRENGSQQVMFFWHLHVLPPIRICSI